MKTFTYLFFIISIFLQISVNAQTFWGVTNDDGTYGGGTIFSYDAGTGTYTDEYVFKPNPIYAPWNVFEESAGVYVGVCEKSTVDGTNDSKSNRFIYRYTQATNTSEIIGELPHPFHVQNKKYAPGNIVYFNNDEIIGFVLNNDLDSIILIRYSVSADSYSEVAKYSTTSYPAEGAYSYSATGCYFSIIDNSTIIFSLKKIKGIADSESTNEGIDFFVFNPQDNSITTLFNVPYADKFLPQGPIAATSTGLLYCPGSKKMMKINLSGKTYSLYPAFGDDEHNEVGEITQITDTTFVGLMDYYSYDYLYEYSFVNDTIVRKLSFGVDDNNINTFIHRGDAVYFSIETSNQYMIMGYKPDGNPPYMVYTLTNPAQGGIDHLVNISDNNKLLALHAGLSEYFIDKKAYVCLERFGGNGSFWSYKYGASPQSDLLFASNKKLYGVASNGGRGTYYHGDGVLFEVDPQTKTYVPLHYFTGEDGGFGSKAGSKAYTKCQNTLTEYNGKIYGTTYTNGTPENAPGYGTVFTYDLNAAGNNFIKIFDFNDSTDASAGRLITSGLILGKDNKLYGLTTYGGIGGESSGHGVMFAIDPNDNDKFSVVMKFADTETMYPVDNLTMADDGKMYGLIKKSPTSNIYWSNWGIREYDVANKTYADIYVTADDDHEKAYSGFLYLNGKLYGMAYSSSNESNGYIFEYDIASNQLVKKVIFAVNRTNGANPMGNLMLSSTGSLWGMTTHGGGEPNYDGSGVIFEYNLSTDTYTKHYSFASNAEGGREPLYSTITEVSDNSTSIHKNNLENKIKAYPNPAVDFVRFNMESDAVTSVVYSVVDASGNMIISGKADVSNSFIIDLEGLQSGIYIVKIDTGSNVYTKKIVKK